MKVNSRTTNTLNNLMSAWIGQFLNIVIQFVSRSVFIYILGAEYLGINGLFTNILTVLSFAELGLGSAIIYSLYEPLALKNNEKINTLLRFYKNSYFFIGSIIFIIGIILMPFLNFFIKDIQNIPHIKLIYLLFLINSVISYFYSYKASFLIADQRKYIFTRYQYLFKIICNIIQIFLLFITHNYYLYLICQVGFTWLMNIYIGKYFNKMYPFLNINNNLKLDNDTFKEIVRNTGAMFFHKVGNIVVNTTDNIILSRFIGLLEVANYSNYKLITSMLDTTISHIFSSITASIGNLAALESLEKTKKIFNTIFFINFWIYGFSSISLLILFNTFITFWLGKEFLFNEYIVLIIVINFYINGMRKTVLVFRDALGLFWYDRYKPLFEASINLVFSIILVKKIGVSGILIGTLLSTILTCFWVEPYVLYKYGFKQSVVDYFSKYLLYTILGGVTCIITIEICNYINGNIIFLLMAKLLVCCIVPNLLFILFFFRKDEYTYLKNKLFNLIKN